MTDATILKLALLAEWQYLCHDDFDEDTEMNEDQYWSYLQSRTPDELNKMSEEDFDTRRTPKRILSLYETYLSPRYHDMILSGVN